MTMRRYLTGVLMAALIVLLLACAASVAGARAAYTTSKPVTSNAPKKDRPFIASGSITPKSTSSNKATVKIILWMKYGTGWGVMDTYWAKVSARSSGSSKYSVTITIPMKGDHGVQAVQYRKGKKVSQSATKYFTVQP
jgi:hypothetical protein